MQKYLDYTLKKDSVDTSSRNTEQTYFIVRLKLCSRPEGLVTEFHGWQLQQ